MVRREGKCQLYKGGDERAFQVCRVWDEAAEQLNKIGLYLPEDYNSLKGVVSGRKVELRLGSEPWHKAHIDLDNRVLEYYNDELDVQMNVLDLMEKTGAVCEFISPWEAEEEIVAKGSHVGVRCWWSKEQDKEVLENMPKILAFATSMEARIYEPTKYWPKALSKNEQRVREAMEALIEEWEQDEWYKLERKFDEIILKEIS